MPAPARTAVELPALATNKVVADYGVQRIVHDGLIRARPS
jgi:hypothetical protein